LSPACGTLYKIENRFYHFSHLRMDARTRERIRAIGGEAISFDVPMSRYTTFGVGGSAEAVFRAKGVQRLKEMVSCLTSERIPYLVVGRGSNLLVGDGGVAGVVIVLNGALASIEPHTAGEPHVTAGAGIGMNALINFCMEQGLAGLEFLAGIPGTLGGGVAMNAGAWGKEIREVIMEITILTSEGDIRCAPKDDLGFQYRELDLPEGSIIIKGRLGLNLDRPSSVKDRVISYLEDRKRRQPIDARSAGSVFKNPKGDYAGRLIEAAGLKGKRVGGAMISTRHANFIVNTGGASAADIAALMDMAQDTVREMFGVELLPEIRRVGNL
jgi:UDP-N-acetylmuramate dehydrogenase